MTRFGSERSDRPKRTNSSWDNEPPAKRSRKQELEKFFEEHKDEEWFQAKYHPEISKESTELQQENLKKRLDIFNELVSQNGFNKELRFDIDNCENLIRFMDAAVIRLEGGSNEDVELMMQEPISDEAIDEVKKKLAPSTNGDGEQNGNGDTKANGAPKTDAAEDESEPIKELLKRVPYKTTSIFFRNIPSTAKKDEIETECKNFPGFLRIGFSEPLSDQNFSRRLWASYRRDVKIREIFWNIKNAKFVTGDAQPSVNRDLRRRVRTINGIAHHRPVVQNDIRQAARLIALYDHKRKLFVDEEQTEEAKDLDALVGRSKNPILDGIFEYFVEESNAEEEELLGVSKQDGDDLKFPVEVDKNLIAYLDKLLVYLRVVHSIDYYKQVEYGNEDSMPNRMGMIHVRDFQLSGDEHGKSSTGIPLVPKKMVDSYISGNDERLKATILKFNTGDSSDLKEVELKDPDQVVEAFIQENCVELAKDKWLCPLSGKKFKGPEFIRKHLFSKHEDKIESKKSEAMFFNNYLKDADRPRNPEPKPITSQAPANNDDSRRNDDDRGGHRGGNWNDRPRYSGPRFNNNRFADYNRNRGTEEFGARRSLVNYRDLDAPSNEIM